MNYSLNELLGKLSDARQEIRKNAFIQIAFLLEKNVFGCRDETCILVLEPEYYNLALGLEEVGIFMEKLWFRMEKGDLPHDDAIALLSILLKYSYADRLYSVLAVLRSFAISLDEVDAYSILANFSNYVLRILNLDDTLSQSQKAEIFFVLNAFKGKSPRLDQSVLGVIGLLT